MAPVKKTAKKKTAVKKAMKTFDLLSTDIVAQTQESLITLTALKKNKAITLDTLNTFDKPYLPFDHLGLQIGLNAKGLQSEKVYETIAAEGVGKTTLAFTIAGMGIKNNIPCLYIETENKPMLRDRIERCLSSDVALSKRMADTVITTKAFELNQAWDFIKTQLTALRETNETVIPKEVPVFIIIDSFSKLMSKEQAQGRLNYGKYAENKKAFKEAGEGTNFGHSKFAQWWCRELPNWLSENNAILWIVSHQNDKINMSSFGGGSLMDPDVAASFNKTKIGGRALNQNAAVQAIVTRKGFYKDGTTQVGDKLCIKVAKNSYGPGNNQIEYMLKTRHTNDSVNYQEPCLNFDEGLADLLAFHGILGTTVTRKRYTCKSLGVDGATAKNFCEALHANEEAVTKIGAMFNIAGYPRLASLETVSEEDMAVNAEIIKAQALLEAQAEKEGIKESDAVKPEKQSVDDAVASLTPS